MITVYCHGGLRDLGPYRVSANSVVKACRLIACQVPRFDNAMRSMYFRVRVGPRGGGGKTLRAGREKLVLPDTVTEIHITPAGVAGIGKNRTMGKLIMGVALIAIGITGGILAGAALGAGLAAGLGSTAAFGISWGSIALTGASMVATAAAQMLSGSPQVANYNDREAPTDRPNFLFSRATNTVNEGAAVAWVWGKRVFKGTNVISAGIVNEQIGPGLPAPPVSGLIGTINGQATGTVIAAMGGGKKAKFKPPEESQDSLQSKSIGRILEVIGEGELELVDERQSIFLDRTPVDNEDATTNFPGYVATWRNGTADQTSIPGISELESFIDVGAVVIQSTPVVRQITNADASGARVHVRFAQGLRRIDTSGDIRPTTVTFVIEYRSNGGDWVVAHDVKLVGKAAPNFQLDYRIDLPAGGAPWDVQVRRTQVDAANVNQTDEITFAGYTMLIDARLRYPYSALLLHEIDSKAFGFDIPNRMVCVRRIDGLVPSNYDPETREYNSFWDGTFKAGCTDNPVWGFRDLVTSNRYGCGEDIDEEMIDDGSLYVAAQYCDELVPDGTGTGGMEPRYTFNGSLDTREDAYKVLSSMAAAFRGMIYWGPGAVIVSQDRPKDIKGHVIAANTLDAQILWEGLGLRSRHTVVKVTWNDPERLGDPAIAYESDYENAAIIGQRETDLYAWGCTSEGQAHRMARWVLETEKTASEVGSWKAAFDQAALAPGDIVEVSDETKSGTLSYSGRIIARDTVNDTITVDRAVELTPPDTYILSLIGPDGIPFERTVTNAPGVYTVLELGSALPNPPPLTGSTWILKSDSLQPIQVQIVRNAQLDRMEFAISGALHDPDKFDRVELEIKLPPRPTSKIPDVRPTQPTVITAREYVYQAGPQVKAAALVEWTVAMDPTIRGFEVEYAAPGEGIDDFTPLGAGSLAQTRVIDDITPGTYTFRVRAYSHIGVRSDWTTAQIPLLGQLTTYETVEQFRGSVSGQVLNLSWSAIDDVRMPPYELRYSNILTEVPYAQMGLLQPLIYGTQTTVPAVAGTYAIKAKDAFTESEEAKYLIIAEVPGDFNVVDEVSEEPTWSGVLEQLVLLSGALVFEPNVTGPGIYTADPYDLGDVYPTRVSSVVTAEAVDTDDVMANWVTLSQVITLSGVSPADWSITIEIRTTPDDPNASPVWSEWLELVNGVYTARGIQRRLIVEVSKPSVQVVITAWHTILDMEDRLLPYEDIVSSSGGVTHFTFDPPFKLPPKIYVTAQDMNTGDYYRVTNKTASGVDVRFFNSANAGISRTFDLLAVGFGKGLVT